MARTNMVNYQTNAERIYNLNAKISSKTKISQPYENTGIYVDATRLDYELEVLSQIRNGTQKASEFAKNSDNSLNSFVETLTTFKTKLIQAANQGAHSETSRIAIANDLKALRNQLVNISNTAINGQFLFSGTAIDTKPISNDGSYNGNGKLIQVVSGTNQTIPYNVDGKELFLGRDNDYSKIVTTNITLYNEHQKLLPSSTPTLLKSSDNIYKLIGGNYQTKALNTANPLDYTRDFSAEKVDKATTQYQPTIFFMQGQKPTGESFSTKFELTPDSSVQDMLDRIGQALGNDPATGNKVVDVSLNEQSQIVVKNLKAGNEMLNFSIFGLTAQKNVGENQNDVTNRTAQIRGLTNLDDINAMVAGGNVHLTSLISSPAYNKIQNGNNFIDKSNTLDYDKVFFNKSARTLTSNVSQIVRADNSFANDGTTLAAVAGLNAGQSLANADDLMLQIRSRNGDNYVAVIDFNGTQANGQSYPTLSLYTHPMQQGQAPLTQMNFYKTQWNAGIKAGSTTEQIGDEPRLISANELTFRNIEDMVQIIASDHATTKNAQGVLTGWGDLRPQGNPPTQDQMNTAAKAAWDNNFSPALRLSSQQVSANMNERGQMVIKDNISSVTDIEVAIYQKHNQDYPADTNINAPSNGSVLSFMRNDAVMIDRPSVNIFPDLDEIIQAVEDGSFFGNPDGTNHRTSGVQGALTRIDHIMDHVNKEHAIIGARSNLITATNNRAELLTLNVSEVKSNVIDTDYGEVLLELQQRMLSYQAMLSSTAKISQLSLLNYM
ncbi:distal flagellar hook-filament junction protein [Candidatus Campylobacter infans]|uniref:Distal flagellar hook-filament junction protein n=2 Tax=Candidatus Campylobacter infans TaxID=2561898 RepID=A0A7H9CI03_9BACT|nr:distal flagellar hook-filament junction protein [Candidatus Campylobacter infans]